MSDLRDSRIRAYQAWEKRAWEKREREERLEELDRLAAGLSGRRMSSDGISDGAVRLVAIAAVAFVLAAIGVLSLAAYDWNFSCLVVRCVKVVP